MRRTTDLIRDKLRRIIHYQLLRTPFNFTTKCCWISVYNIFSRQLPNRSKGVKSSGTNLGIFAWIFVVQALLLVCAKCDWFCVPPVIVVLGRGWHRQKVLSGWVEDEQRREQFWKWMSAASQQLRGRAGHALVRNGHWRDLGQTGLLRTDRRKNW